MMLKKEEGERCDVRGGCGNVFIIRHILRTPVAGTVPVNGPISHTQM